MELYHGTRMNVAFKLLRGDYLHPWTPAGAHIKVAHEYGRTADRSEFYAVIVLDQEKGGFTPSCTGYWDSDHHLPVPRDGVIRIEFYKKNGLWNEQPIFIRAVQLNGLPC